MYSSSFNLVLGFHGCDKKVAEQVVAGKKNLISSKNDYDWLGHGIYFWELNPSRALAYAQFLKANPKRSNQAIIEPYAIGAVIDLGYCLNLLETKSLQILKGNYELLSRLHDKSGIPMPSNTTPDSGDILLLRKLDCAVVEMTHTTNRENNERQYDSVRGVFVEGQKLYENSGFNEKNHIQICIRNPNCIKGYFLPRDYDRTHRT